MDDRIGPPASPGFKTYSPRDPDMILREIIGLIDGVVQEAEAEKRAKRG